MQLGREGRFDKMTQCRAGLKTASSSRRSACEVWRAGRSAGPSPGVSLWCYRFDEGWTLRAEGWPASSGRRAVAVLSPNPISLRRVGGVCETPSRVRSSIPLDPPTPLHESMPARAVPDPLPFHPLPPPQGRRPYEPSGATGRMKHGRDPNRGAQIGARIRQVHEKTGVRPAALREQAAGWAQNSVRTRRRGS